MRDPLDYKIDAARSIIDTVAIQGLVFIEEYRPLLEELRQVRQLISLTSFIFKSQGLSERSAQYWRERLEVWKAEQQEIFEAVIIRVSAIEQYVSDHQKLISKHTSLICCSDIIESTFGRYKNKDGLKAISTDVLKIPLYNVDITLDFVDRGLNAVTH